MSTCTCSRRGKGGKKEGEVGRRANSGEIRDERHVKRKVEVVRAKGRVLDSNDSRKVLW
jgi:hypothetical protein